MHAGKLLNIKFGFGVFLCAILLAGCSLLTGGVRFPVWSLAGPLPEALVAGTLTNVGGCLRIVSVEHHVDHLLIWPESYTLQMVSPIRVLDEKLAPAAIEGQQVTLSGGESQTIEQLGPAVVQAAGSCGGPYWAVTGHR
ncbi:MAG: hypothetical protein QOH61_1030 [Chloroflexota bacterium]|jgi:hypothetical protein|nr:hypothetical protein [Chloroflexota bacterium]